jgi:outer membrane protein TolC
LLTQGTCYAAILLMSGCTASGPQYSLPSQSVAQRPAAAAPFLAAGETVYRSTPLPDNWWQLYDEPVMNALIQEALNANADLKVAAANLARTRAVEKETADATTPTIGLSAAPSAGRASAAARGLPNALPDSWSYDSTASVSYQADLFGKIARATEAANADTQAAQAGYDLVRISVVADTARAYTEACSAMRQITIGQQSIDLQKKPPTSSQNAFNSDGEPRPTIRVRSRNLPCCNRHCRNINHNNVWLITSWQY